MINRLGKLKAALAASLYIANRVKVLDRIPISSKGVFGLRKLRRNYNGPAVRVRRANDNAEMDFGFTKNGELDVTALLLFCGVFAGYVVTWYDQSGNGNHASQSTPSKQPRIVDQGATAALHFTSANSQFAYRANSADFQSMVSTGFSIMGHIKPATLPASFTHWIAHKYPFFQLGYSDTGQLSFQTGGSWLPKSGASVTAGSWHFVSAGHAPGVGNFINLNGGTRSTNTTASVTNDATRLTIGASNSGTGCIDGDIDNLGFWARPITSTEETWFYNSGNGRRYDELGIPGTDGENLLNGLYAFYTMDQGTGDIIDVHNGNNLTTTANRPTLATGIVKDPATVVTLGGQPSLDFTAVNQQILQFSGTGLGLTQNIAALTANIVWEPKLDGAWATPIYFSGELVSTTRVSVGKNADNKLMTGGRKLDADSFSFVTSSQPVGGSPYVTTALFDYSYTRLEQFMNGVSDGNSVAYQSGSAGTATSDIASAVAYIGGAHNSNYMDGKIAEVVFYQAALPRWDRFVLEEEQGRHFGIELLHVDFADYFDTFFREPLSDSPILLPFQVSSDVGSDTEPGIHCPVDNIWPEICYQVTSRASDPSRNVYQVVDWGDRDSSTATQLGTFNLPDNFILPDVTPPTTPNNPFICVNANAETALYLHGTARPSAGGNIWGYNTGTHGASRTFGGEITLDELLSGKVERAWGLLIWTAKYLSNDGTGYVYPARAADAKYNTVGHADYYGGDDIRLKMGVRFAIPRSRTALDIGISSTPGKALLYGAHNHGAYVLDNTAYNAVHVCVTPDAKALIRSIRSEILLMLKELQYVEAA